jgi:parallel beta-helix repeat protein
MYGGTTLGIRLEHCIHTVISGNTLVSRPSAYRDLSRDGILLEDCTGCAVTGNVMNDSRAGDATSGGCVTLRNCNETAVSSCQILDPKFRGVHLEDTTRCTVTGNTIADRRHPREMLTAVAVTGRSQDNVIQANAVTRGTQDAIACDATRGVVLNNTIWD